MIAFSAGGRLAATCSALKPPQEIPVMPTLPLHQGCAASCAMISQASSCSSGRYSSARSPSESPEPRRSIRAQAMPWPASQGWISTSRATVPSRRRYGTISTTTGTLASPRGRHSVTAMRVPSASVIHSGSTVSTSKGYSVRTKGSASQNALLNVRTTRAFAVQSCFPPFGMAAWPNRQVPSIRRQKRREGGSVWRPPPSHDIILEAPLPAVLPTRQPAPALAAPPR